VKILLIETIGIMAGLFRMSVNDVLGVRGWVHAYDFDVDGFSL
jgi:hypothetical protein